MSSNSNGMALNKVLVRRAAEIKMFRLCTSLRIEMVSQLTGCYHSPAQFILDDHMVLFLLECLYFSTMEKNSRKEIANRICYNRFQNPISHRVYRLRSAPQGASTSRYKSYIRPTGPPPRAPVFIPMNVRCNMDQRHDLRRDPGF